MALTAVRSLPTFLPVPQKPRQSVPLAGGVPPQPQFPHWTYPEGSDLKSKDSGLLVFFTPAVKNWWSKKLVAREQVPHAMVLQGATPGLWAEGRAVLGRSQIRASWSSDSHRILRNTLFNCSTLFPQITTNARCRGPV